VARRRAAAALALLAAGCGTPQSVMEPAGPAARTLAGLGHGVLVLASVISGAVIAIVVAGALKSRGSLAEHAPPGASGGKAWIVAGFAGTALVLGAVFLVSLSVMGRFPMAMHGGERIRVVGHQWWWEVQYLDGGPAGRVPTANEIHIPVGVPVDIALESRDVIHSFWVPRLHGKVDLIPGTVNRIRIRADRAGVYPGQCAEYCGVQHAHMALLVVVEPRPEFEAWLARQRAPASPPSSQEERRGRQLFETHACSFCHTVRGTEAAGSVAPDLTHLASRLTLAAGMLPNTRANLSAWVVNAPSLKPGTQMPAMTQFTGEELRALVGYLESLK
jgi:cytochrome c oxidase subunit 2